MISAQAGRRTAVITGGTDGIGAATARALRDGGVDVVVLGRSQTKADRLLAEDRDRPGSLRAIVTDLALMANVVAAVSELRRSTNRIDLLLHAVGVLVAGTRHTTEGLELDFATSYLGRYLFLEEASRVGLLHPGTRLVNVAASAPRVPRLAQVEFGSLAAVEGRTGMRGHGQAQLANDLLTAVAPARYGITAVGYGPGAVDTSIRRDIPRLALAVLGPLYARTTRTPERAAADVVTAFDDPGLAPGTASFRNRSGGFPPSGYVTDPRRQQELMAVSEALVARALS